MASQNRGHCRSEPTATASSPSRVANVSYGTMFGWALPRRPATGPVTNAFCAWFDEHRERRRRAATRRSVGRAAAPPTPTGAISPARIPIAANSPVTTSLIATPTLSGRPPSASASPVIDISPPTAWITKS